MPVLDTTPLGVARPNAPVARSSSRIVTPAWARTVRRTGSTWIPFISEKSIIRPAFRDRFPGDVVPAASDRELEPGVSGGIDGVNHVSEVEAPGDERRPLVDQAVVNFASRVVAGVLWRQQLAGESFAQGCGVIGGGHVGEPYARQVMPESWKSVHFGTRSRENGPQTMAGELRGREHETRSIEEFLERVARSPEVLILVGEPGVGKTTLWQVGLAQARAAGIRVLAHRAVEAEANPGFHGRFRSARGRGRGDTAFPQRAAAPSARNCAATGRSPPERSGRTTGSRSGGAREPQGAVR